MKTLGILKIEDIYKQQCLTLVHDALNDNCPDNIKSIIKLTATKNQYSLRDKEKNPLDLQKPNLRTKQGRGSFKMTGPDNWNNLPNHIKKVQKRDIFRKCLKRHLLTDYNYMVTCTNPLCKDRGHHSSD